VIVNVCPAAVSSASPDAIWSVLDAPGTQNMMKSALGEAAQLADYDMIKNRLKGSRYKMDFNNGVKFDLDVPPAPFVAVTLFVAGSAAPEPKL